MAMTARVRGNVYNALHAERHEPAPAAAATDTAEVPVEPEFVPLYPPTRAFKVLHPLRARKHDHLG